MKNKGLMVSVGVILVVLIGFFAFQLGKTSQESPASQVEIKRVGILQFVSHPALDTIREGIVKTLEEGGFKDGETIKIDVQNGQADQSKLATMSEQLISNKSDVLVGIATPAAQALANKTTQIPIILGAVTDPVGAKLVEDMEKPGKNITGVSDKSPVDKQIRLGKELLPQAKTVGMLYSSNEDNSKYQVAEASKAAKELGLEVKEYAVPSTNELAQTVQVMSGQVDFIYIPLDNTIANAMPTVVAEANKKKIPIIPSVDTMVEQGGLATVGINQFEIGVQIGKMVIDSLNGANPATTPIYTFTDGETLINQKQAELLGISIPGSIKTTAKIIGEE